MWRNGTKVPVNLYKDDVIAGQCQTPELAAEIVAAMNGVARRGAQAGVAAEMVDLRAQLDAAKQRAIQWMDQALTAKDELWNLKLDQARAMAEALRAEAEALRDAATGVQPDD